MRMSEAKIAEERFHLRHSLTRMFRQPWKLRGRLYARGERTVVVRFSIEKPRTAHG